MSHVRQQIREAAAALLTGLTTSGARVYQSRLHALRDSNLPALLVNTDSEDIEAMTIHAPTVLDRTLDLQVRAVAKATSNLDDTLDTMIKEIEVVMGAASVMPTLCKTVILTHLAIEMADMLETPVGVATLSYRITYNTSSNAPGTAI